MYSLLNVYENSYREDMKAVLFDLDGTLFDTLEDIRSAINYALRAWDGTEASADDVRRYVGRGLRRAMASATAEHCSQLEEGEGELMFQLMKSYYRNHPAVYASFYPGVRELLSALKNAGVKVGIVSNKDDGILKEIVSASGFAFDYAAGEKPGIPLKPDPKALLDAVAALGSDVSSSVFVGDSEVDAETGKRAGIETLIVSWGFRTADELASSGIHDTSENAEKLWFRMSQSPVLSGTIADRGENHEFH